MKRAPAEVYPNENLKAEIISSPMSLLSKALLAPQRSFDSCLQEGSV